MKTFFRALVFFVFLFTGGVAQTVSGDETGPVSGESSRNRVLYITAASSSGSWSEDIITGLRDTLLAYDVGMHLDVLELNEVDQASSIDDVVSKITDFALARQYSLVIVAQNAFVDHLFEYYGEAKTKDLPILFTGYFGKDPLGGKSHPLISGIYIPIDIIESTIRQGLVNQPDAAEILVVVSDGLPETQAAMATLQTSGSLPERPDIRVISRFDNTREAVVAEAGKLEKNSFIVYATWRSMMLGTGGGMNAFMQINALGKYPMYALNDSREGPMTAGGYMVKGQDLGKQTARMAMRYFRGEPISDIPVEKAEIVPQYDWSALRRLGFSAGNVPKEAVFVNVTQPFHVRHRNLVLTLGTVLLTALVFGSFTVMKRRQRLMRERHIFTALPIRVCACDLRGKIYYLITNGPDSGFQNAKIIDELPGVNDRFHEHVRHVIETGNPTSFDYISDGSHRRADFIALPPEVFGVPTALWVSVDIETEFMARQEATNHAERFHFTLSAINDGVIAVDTKETITLVNPAALRLLQTAEMEIIGKKLTDVFPLIDATTGVPVLSSAEKALKTGTIVERKEPLIFVRKDGARLHISDSTAPICDHKGRVTGAVLVFRDVSDEQLRNAHMHEQNTFLGASAELAGITYFRMENDHIRGPLDARYWASDDRGIPVAPEVWVASEDLPAFIAAQEELRQGKPKVHVRYGSDYTGTRRYFEMTVCLLGEETPGYRRWLGVIRDTTESRREEQQHQDTLQLLQRIMDCLPCHVFVKNIDNGFRYELCNRLNTYTFERPVEEILGRTDAEMLPAEEADAIHRDDLRAIEAGEPLEVMSHFVKPNGEVMRGKVFKQVFQKANGDRLLLGVAIDMTQELKIQEEIHNANILLQGIMDNLDCILWIKEHPSGRYIMVNRYYSETIGIPVEEMVGMTDAQFHPAEIAASFARTDQEAFETKGGITIQNDIIQTPNKGRRNMVTRKVRLTRKDGEDVILGMSYDITEQVNAREALSRTNAIFQAILENLPVGIIVKDPAVNYEYMIWNKATERFTGVPAADVLGRNDFDVPALMIDPVVSREQDVDAVMKGNMIDQELSVTDFEGKARDIHYIKQRIALERGASLVLVLFHDISLEKEQQRKLRGLTDTLSAYIDQERLINRFMESLVLNDDNTAALVQILKIIGERISAANCYVFKYDYDENLMQPEFEWFPEDGEATIEKLPVCPLDSTEAWYKLFNEKKPLVLEDLTQPEQQKLAGCRFEAMERMGVKTVYAIGLRSGGKLWGHLEVDFTEDYAFTILDHHLMEAAAHIVELIIERSIIHENLERSQNDKQLIIDTIPVPVMLFDTDRNLISVNQAAVQRSRFTEEQLLSQPCYVSYCGFEDGPPGLGCPFRKVMETGEPQYYSYRDGEREMDATVTPVFDKKTKEIIYVVESAIDMTDFNESQRKLTKAMQEALSADKAKSLFLATMSHELRTPLNAVIGFSELLQSGTLSLVDQKECFRSINLAGSALLALINDVLDLSKIEADQVEITPVSTNINLILDEIEAIFRHKAEQKDIFISVDVPENLPILSLDNLRFRQVILNLVGNAIKFTKIGGITIRVRFTPEKDNPDEGTVVVAVSDSGIGIAPEQQERIFQPFVQESATTRGNRSYEGTGLGLTISTRLVEYMGGKIELVSQLGQGSTFTITLPHIKIMEEKGLREHPEGLPKVPAPAPKSQFTVPSYPPKKILIVDDVPLNLKVLGALLNRIGQTPLTADNATDALKIIKKEHPDLIITDIWMPKITGEELARAIRELPEIKDTPILAITADTEADTTFEMNLFNARLFKPITIPALVEALHPYLAPHPES